MCYHTSQTKTTSQLEVRFKVKRDAAFDIKEEDFTFYHVNGFAHPNLLMIPQRETHLLTPAIWGLLPSNVKGTDRDAYFKESVRFGGGLNARDDKLFSHFMYKSAIRERRCLIPVTGFFEPYHQAKKSYPVYIHPANREPVALGGIYQVSEDGYVSMAIITKNAQPRLAAIHNEKKRQPLLLTPESEKLWLDDKLTDADIQDVMRAPFDTAQLNAWPVSKLVFNSRADSNVAEALEPERYEGVPGMF